MSKYINAPLIGGGYETLTNQNSLLKRRKQKQAINTEKYLLWTNKNSEGWKLNFRISGNKWLGE